MSVNAINVRIFLPGIDGAAGSDGTNGDAEKDLKGADNTPPPVDNETTDSLSALDRLAKYAGNVAGWSDSDSYGNSEYAYEIARFSMNQHSFGTNPFQNNDFSKLVAQQQAANKGHTVGESIWSLA